MKKIQQKIITILLILVMLGQAVTPSIVIAEEGTPTPPPTETQPAEQTQTTTEQTQPASSPAPTEQPRRENESSRRRAEDEAREAAEAAAQAAQQTTETTNNTEPTATNEVTPQNTTGSQDNSGNGEQAIIDTGDATTNGAINNNVNSNVSAGDTSGSGGATVANTNNGSGSTNTGSATTSNENDTTQINTATVNNNAELGAETGNNTASRNYGGASVSTGDANVSGTIVNSVNTNVDGVAVAEFNVVDDHVGDIILDFGDINCVTNCGSGNISAVNSGNGADSTNNATIANVNDSETFQYNDADVDNDMTLSAITGGNSANDNIGGDVTIETGDANVAANMLNFVNNNIAGNVIYGVVNIFGDLIGDIILPDNPFANCASCMANNTTVTNSGNGADSTNTGTVGLYDYDSTFQYNDADIDNNMIIDANTGGNETSGNIGGDKSITTGDTNVSAQTFNIANSNLIGGDWWLVIVNEAGNWIGRIMGAPEGSNYAGSVGTEFMVDEYGQVTAVNNGNLAGSTNNAGVTNVNNNSTTQINNANVDNNLYIDADTGHNEANRNGSGDVRIDTGDVNIAANIVNFVNNNISGGGRLFVTMINIFGSWTGNVITPGQQKVTETAQNNIGGQNNSPSNSSNGSSNSNSDSNNTSKVETTSGTGTTALVIESEDDTKDKNYTFGSVQGDKTGKSSEATVATIVGQDDSAAVAEKTLHINLAWMLLAFPLIASAMLMRKMFVPVKTLALKGIHLFL